MVDQPQIDDTEQPVKEGCPQCGRDDTVVISTFRWGGVTRLSWRCTHCADIWITPERRKTPR